MCFFQKVSYILKTFENQIYQLLMNYCDIHGAIWSSKSERKTPTALSRSNVNPFSKADPFYHFPTSLFCERNFSKKKFQKKIGLYWLVVFQFCEKYCSMKFAIKVCTIMFDYLGSNKYLHEFIQTKILDINNPQSTQEYYIFRTSP